MVKNVLKKDGHCTALVSLGWLSFFGGLLLNNNHPVIKIILMAIARVLP